MKNNSDTPEVSAVRKYRCTITSGGGTKQDGGDFIIKETPKTLIFECVRQPFFSAYNQMIGKKPVRINKYYSKKNPRDNYEAWRSMEHYGLPYIGYFNSGHVARKWEDGTWTIYPNQCGTPHFLEIP